MERLVIKKSVSSNKVVDLIFDLKESFKKLLINRDNKLSFSYRVEIVANYNICFNVFDSTGDNIFFGRLDDDNLVGEIIESIKDNENEVEDERMLLMDLVQDQVKKEGGY